MTNTSVVSTLCYSLHKIIEQRHSTTLNITLFQPPLPLPAPPVYNKDNTSRQGWLETVDKYVYQDS